MKPKEIRDIFNKIIKEYGCVMNYLKR